MQIRVTPPLWLLVANITFVSMSGRRQSLMPGPSWRRPATQHRPTSARWRDFLTSAVSKRWCSDWHDMISEVWQFRLWLQLKEESKISRMIQIFQNGAKNVSLSSVKLYTKMYFWDSIVKMVWFLQKENPKKYQVNTRVLQPEKARIWKDSKMRLRILFGSQKYWNLLRSQWQKIMNLNWNQKQWWKQGNLLRKWQVKLTKLLKNWNPGSSSGFAWSRSNHGQVLIPPKSLRLSLELSNTIIIPQDF